MTALKPILISKYIINLLNAENISKENNITEVYYGQIIITHPEYPNNGKFTKI